MPGHKGKGDIEKYDLTEIEGADSLFAASGIIARSEALAGEIFGADSYYSAEGSSLSIRAMLYLATLYTKTLGKEPLVLAGRNAHKSFLSAASLIGFDIEWLTSKTGSYLSSTVTAGELEEKLSSMKKKPSAIYLTTPDYLGGMIELGAIAKVCKKEGILLLVDNAHGGYLKFLSPSRHPIDLGADMCADSAHKTLHALTGAGYLHLSKSLPPFFKSGVKSAMEHFASTSPSYLILASLDGLIERLSGDFSRELQTKVSKIASLKREIAAYGYEVLEGEPLKITLSTKSYGYLGTELSSLLYKRGIVSEFSDPDYLVLMPSVDTTEDELSRLGTVLSEIERRAPITDTPPALSLPERRITPREAFLLPYEEISAEKSSGRILAAETVACPPAVPIVASGELIDKTAVKAFLYYGIKTVKVIK